MRIAKCVVLVLLAAGACGSDSDDAAQKEVPAAERPTAGGSEVAEVIATSLRETGESDPNGLQFTASEAECAAELTTDEIKLARLEELGLKVDSGVGPELSVPPLTTPEGDAVYRAYEACLNLPAQVEALLASGGTMTEDVGTPQSCQ
jgi:hypothetical protein